MLVGDRRMLHCGWGQVHAACCLGTCACGVLLAGAVGRPASTTEERALQENVLTLQFRLSKSLHAMHTSAC